MKLIKKSIKRKINTTRILLILFVVLMVIVGNLPILADIFGWDEIQVQIMSIIIGFVASAIITYVIRRPR
jgi:heme/copper-type cytochrome/quinol oxidase subunit 4